MSFWSSTGNQVIVANQNGRMLERVDVRRNSSGAVTDFVFNAAASLDLVGGPGRILAKPMAIVGEYDLSQVNADGCGGMESNQYMHMSTGTPGPNISEFTVYRFGLDYPSAPFFNAPNTPEPLAVWEDPDNGKIAGSDLPAGSNRDAHGMALTGDELHQFDRIRNVVEVFKMEPPWNQLIHSDTMATPSTWPCGSLIPSPSVMPLQAVVLGWGSSAERRPPPAGS